MAKKQRDQESTALSEPAEVETSEAADESPDLTGLVKMHRDGRFIHAHPTTVEHHKSNGWNLA